MRWQGSFSVLTYSRIAAHKHVNHFIQFLKAEVVLTLTAIFGTPVTSSALGKTPQSALLTLTASVRSRRVTPRVSGENTQGQSEGRTASTEQGPNPHRPISMPHQSCSLFGRLFQL